MSLFYALTASIALASLLAQTAAGMEESALVLSSEYHVQNWQTEDGLPQNTVNAVAQTPDGFLWIGTLNGLMRFDGHRFDALGPSDFPEFRREPYVWSLVVSPAGALWIGSTAGLFRMEKGHFSRVDLPGRPPSDLVRGLYLDRTGVLWIGTGDGLLYRYAGGSITRYEQGDGLRFEGIMGMCEDPSGVLWVGTAGGLLRSDGAQFHICADLARESITHVYSLAPDPRGGVWVGTRSQGLLRATGSCVDSPAVAGSPRQPIHALFRARDGTLWIGLGYGGLGTMRAGVLRRGLADPLLDNERIRTIFEDRDGNLWIGTEGAGLFCLRPRALGAITVADGLPSDFVHCVYEDGSGSVWVGTELGLAQMVNGRIVVHRNGDHFQDNYICALGEASDGTLLVGTSSGLWTLRDGRFDRVGTFAGAVWSVCADSNGGTWVGTSDGLHLLRDGTLEKYSQDPVLASKEISQIQADGQGTAWIGTRVDGIFRIKGRSITRFTREDGLPDDAIAAVMVGSDGSPWVATRTGLAWRRQNAWRPLAKQAPLLASAEVTAILEDEQHLWLGSARGILRLSKHQIESRLNGGDEMLVPTVFGRADGMISSECNGGRYPGGIVARDGRILFATIKGLVIVDPRRLPRRRFPPAPYILDASVDGRSASTGRAFTSPAGSRSFEFLYSCVDLASSQGPRFAYMLEGFDNRWTEAGASRVAHYTNLKPGSYRFTVRACSNDGSWSREAASVEFRLLPLFHQTWYFIALCVCATGAATWLLYLLRLRQIKGRFRAVFAERQRISRELHDTLAQNLTAVSMQLDAIGIESRGAPGVFQETLSRARRLIGEGLREVRRSVADLRLLALDKRDLHRALLEMAREGVAGTQMTARVDVMGTPRSLPYPVELNLFRIAQEALANAVKHSGGSAVAIELEYRHTSVVLRVKDDGVGLTQSDATHDDAGFGHVGMRERVRVLGGRFDLKSRPGEGTEIEVEAPVQVRATKWWRR